MAENHYDNEAVAEYVRELFEVASEQAERCEQGQRGSSSSIFYGFFFLIVYLRRDGKAIFRVFERRKEPENVGLDNFVITWCVYYGLDIEEEADNLDTAEYILAEMKAHKDEYPEIEHYTPGKISDILKNVKDLVYPPPTEDNVEMPDTGQAQGAADENEIQQDQNEPEEYTAENQVEDEED